MADEVLQVRSTLVVLREGRGQAEGVRRNVLVMADRNGRTGVVGWIEQSDRGEDEWRATGFAFPFDTNWIQRATMRGMLEALVRSYEDACHADVLDDVLKI